MHQSSRSEGSTQFTTFAEGKSRPGSHNQYHKKQCRSKLYVWGTAPATDPCLLRNVKVKIRVRSSTSDFHCRWAHFFFAKCGNQVFYDKTNKLNSRTKATTFCTCTSNCNRFPKFFFLLVYYCPFLQCTGSIQIFKNEHGGHHTFFSDLDVVILRGATSFQAL